MREKCKGTHLHYGFPPYLSNTLSNVLPIKGIVVGVILTSTSCSPIALPLKSSFTTQISQTCLAYYRIPLRDHLANFGFLGQKLANLDILKYIFINIWSNDA